jgi:hypothetical protein
LWWRSRLASFGSERRILLSLPGSERRNKLLWLPGGVPLLESLGWLPSEAREVFFSRFPEARDETNSNLVAAAVDDEEEAGVEEAVEEAVEDTIEEAVGEAIEETVVPTVVAWNI